MTNPAITNIINKLNEVFATADAKVLERSLIWIEERAVAVREFEKAEDAKPRNESLRFTNNSRFYETVFSIAGGKTWYRTIKDNNAVGRAVKMTKHCQRVAEARNATITNKLVKAEVTEVINSEWSYTNDGFNGSFQVNTNKGEKRIKIDTIYAGGYNIQCLHLRTLVSVR